MTYGAGSGSIIGEGTATGLLAKVDELWSSDKVVGRVSRHLSLGVWRDVDEDCLHDYTESLSVEL